EIIDQGEPSHDFGRFRLVGDTLSAISLDPLDAPGPNGGKFLVLRVSNGADCSRLPILCGIPHLDRFSHPVFYAFSVFAGVAFGVMSDKDRLTKWHPVGNRVDCLMRSFSIARPSVAVLFEPFRPFLGTIDQACIFVADLA